MRKEVHTDLKITSPSLSHHHLFELWWCSDASGIAWPLASLVSPRQQHTCQGLPVYIDTIAFAKWYLSQYVRAGMKTTTQRGRREW